jgi:Raf kinase inhibitor-like YbhB/YbcL family protein
MRFLSLSLIGALSCVAVTNVAAQNPPAGGGRGTGGRGGRRTVEVMTLSTPAWPDGGRIPAKHAQPGHDVSPALTWSAAPEGTTGFVLIVHDVDAATGNGTDDVLHWLVWNLPATTTSLGEGIPHGPQRADGSRQISVSGPYYRGPAAPSTGPAHHYIFEIFAVDTTFDIPAVGAAPAATRAAVMAAMAGHVRGKGTMVGLFKRAP